MQLATLTVLSATLTVVAFALSISMNLNRLLTSWGESVQMTVYLLEDVTTDDVKRVHSRLKSMPEVATATYVPKEVATEKFRAQMASYAPDLLDDADLSSPFPSSFRISFSNGIQSESDVNLLEDLARQIGAIEGVEDVSYGQTWVRNYSSFVTALSAGGGIVVMILLAGCLFVVGNSIRVSIAARREEIEILELVGATPRMIRRPYVVEGWMMGFVASVIALVLNFALFIWQKSVMASSLSLARLTDQFSFFDSIGALGFLIAGSLLGCFGAWVTVRKINDGWSASHRVGN